MKIAQILPNWSVFHSDRAIGIKAVVRDLAIGLQKNGHDVTVFAPDGSTFPGHMIRFCGPSLQDQHSSLFAQNSISLQHMYAERIVSELSLFDIVHSHIEHILLPYVSRISAPVVSTIHGAGFEKKEEMVFQTYPGGVFIALSERAKQALPYIHFLAVVYNGLDVSLVPFFAAYQKPGYLAWMGRFSPQKGPLDAIEVGKKTGHVVTLVGFEETRDPDYMQKIRNQADGAMIRVLNKMIGRAKYDFVGNAKALLFPIHWEEPFGLVMIEAMACGTPVIAYNRGSVPEVVKDGVTGFIVDPDRGVEGLVEAVGKIDQIDRAACRKHVEEHFTVEKMVEGYEKVYQKVLGK